MARCVLINNPVSRHSLTDDRLEAVLRIAREAGWDVTCTATQYRGHATEIARVHADDAADVVLVAGGDGTINEAVNGMMASSRRAALAVLPGGTANVWAKETHMPKRPEAAMRAIITGQPRQVDLGRAGERYFLLMAGVGFDAEIVPRVSTRMKRWLGAAAYIVKGAPAAFRADTPEARYQLDGAVRKSPLFWMLIGNTRSYGGLIDISYRARADDGVLDVCMMYRGGVWRLLADGARLLRKRHDRSPNVDYICCRSVDVFTPGLPVQIDGEYAGKTPLRIDVAPLALTVIVPTGLRTPLLHEVPE